MVETIQDYKFYIDVYEDINIEVSSTSNQYGHIYNDVKGNYIGGVLGSGKNYIKMISKTMPNPIIIHDGIQFLYIDNIDTQQDFLIKPPNKIQYKTNAHKNTFTTADNGKVSIDMTDKEVFKLFINGKEDESYTVANDGVTSNKITGVGDYIVLYTYDKIQTITGELVMQYISPNQTLIPEVEFNNPPYREINKFREFSVTFSRTLNDIDRQYDIMTTKRKVDTDNKLPITMYEDIISEVFDTRFRVIGYNNKAQKLVIYNNCIVDEGINEDVNSIKNEFTYNIRFENKILAQYEDNTTLYGSSIYGSEVYGGLGSTVYEVVS